MNTTLELGGLLGNMPLLPHNNYHAFLNKSSPPVVFSISLTFPSSDRVISLLLTVNKNAIEVKINATLSHTGPLTLDVFNTEVVI